MLTVEQQNDVWREFFPYLETRDFANVPDDQKQLLLSAAKNVLCGTSPSVDALVEVYRVVPERKGE